MSVATPSTSADLIARARAVAAVAARHAAAVDAQARFPVEAIAAAREARLLSAAVPADLGGAGATMTELLETCHVVGQACGSSAMVLAMHHIQVALLVRHARGVPDFADHLRALVTGQRLLASVTSEVGVGGDTRTSRCAVERTGDRFTLVKDATAVSYGAHADDLLVTARRAPDAAPSDQVLVLARQGEFTLEGGTGAWDTMGMRGTCSPPFLVRVEGPASRIVPGPYADASAETMVPYSHLLWAGLWVGIAADAMARAAAAVRAAARRAPGETPPTATRLAELSVAMQALRANVWAAARDFDALGDDRAPLQTMGWALRCNNVKVGTSEAAHAIVHQALGIIGIAGYRNDSPYSVTRHYRDILSAALMVGNERILAKSAAMLLVHKDD